MLLKGCLNKTEFSFYSDDLPKTQLRKTVTESLKKALLKQKEQEKDKPSASEGTAVHISLKMALMVVKVTNTVFSYLVFLVFPLICGWIA